MTNVGFGRYKRIVQYFWDPEPKNDDVSKASIWCLGLQYAAAADPTPTQTSKSAFASESQPRPTNSSPTVGFPGPDSNTSSYPDRGLANDEAVGKAETDGAWPSLFLDDFESKVWLTYRSNFPPIARSQDSDASSAMSFSVRLRSQLVDQAGFTTDAGWGCMIRSGQSLLANALVMLNLGRGIQTQAQVLHSTAQN